MTSTLHILGMGSFQPDTVVSNEFIENLDVGTTAEWITDKIGILERKSSLPIDYISETRNADPREALQVRTGTPEDFAVKASEQALARAGITADKIGLIIINCCTPDSSIPSEAVKLATRIGATNALAYDLFTACPAFALHMDHLNSFREEELPEYVLCVSTAALTQKVDYSDRSAGAIWGDGAAAWVVSAKHQGPLSVRETFFAADPLRCDAVVVDTYGFFHQDGRAVRDFSVRQTVRLIKRLESEFDIDWERDVFIGHQANRTMLEQIRNNRKIPEDQHWFNVTNIGNQAAAGAPAVLSENWERLAPGQKIVIAVVGAGLSWGSVLLEVGA